MSAKGKRVIWVGPADGSNAKPANLEAVATTAIKPGTVLNFAAADAGFVANTVAATVFGELFLVADKDQARAKSVDDNWAIDENMVGIQPRSGEFINVLVITGQTLLKGQALSRGGAGLLKLAVTPATVGVTSEEIVAYTDETITTTATTLVRVRVA